MAQNHEPKTEKKPSFVGSVMSGIGGYIKGAFSAGVIGAVAGTLIGAVIAGVSLALGGEGAAATLGEGVGQVAATAITGAAIGGGILAPLGALAGLVTGVVKSRETKQPTADDIVNVAKISFAQGVQVGHHIEHSNHHGEGKGKFEQAYEAGKNKTVMAERQVLQ
jgi:hypothetical protein